MGAYLSPQTKGYDMSKWIITWDIGYGEQASVIYAPTQDAATEVAYNSAREDFENNAAYEAEPYTKQRAEELGV